MEQITLRAQRQWGRCIHSLYLPSYVRVVFIVFMGCAVVSVSAVSLARSTPVPSNPFAVYADIFPGQPGGAIQGRGYSCSTGINEYLPNEHCTLNSASGAFSQIGVVIADNAIKNNNFILRGDTLRLGDLMLLWGTPDIQEQIHSVFLFWRRIGVTAIITEYAGYFSLHLPVRRVLITNDEGLATDGSG